MRDQFSESYPNFRLANGICLLFWAIMMMLLLSRNYLELGDSFSFVFYAGFAVTHVLIIILTFVYRSERVWKILIRLGLVPIIFSGLMIILTLFLRFVDLLKTLEEG
jgi:hypothetical protein